MADASGKKTKRRQPSAPAGDEGGRDAKRRIQPVETRNQVAGAGAELVAASLGGVAQVIAGGAAAGSLASKFSNLFSGAPPPAGSTVKGLLASAAAAAPEAAAEAPRRPRRRAEGEAGTSAAAPAAAAGKDKAPAPERFEKSKKQLSPTELQERETRTVFVGNVPLKLDKKQFRKMLQSVLGDTYRGKLSPIWFRDIPVNDKWSGKLRRAGAILGDYAKGAADSKSAYVVVETPDAVKCICRKIHGHEVDARHVLRADGVGEASRLQSFDRKRSVFVGNLPHNVGEADLREALADAGEVQAVRVVRDRETKSCKGFAFVLFKERKHVKTALGLWGAEVLGRPIRVMKVEKQGAEGDWEVGATAYGQKRRGRTADPAVARFVELRKQKKLKKRMAQAAKRKAEAIAAGGGRGKKKRDKRDRGRRAR